MDWQKCPKSKMSIKIRQPKTLDSIKCHTFSGLGSRTLDILLHNSTLQLFCAKGFNWNTCPHKQFYCDTGQACACTSPPVLLAYFQLPSQLDAWPKAVSGQDCWLRQAARSGLVGCWPAYLPKQCGCWPSKTRLVCVNCTATSHLSSRGLFLHRAWVRSWSLL